VAPDCLAQERAKQPVDSSIVTQPPCGEDLSRSGGVASLAACLLDGVNHLRTRRSPGLVGGRSKTRFGGPEWRSPSRVRTSADEDSVAGRDWHHRAPLRSRCPVFAQALTPPSRCHPSLSAPGHTSSMKIWLQSLCLAGRLALSGVNSSRGVLLQSSCQLHSAT